MKSEKLELELEMAFAELEDAKENDDATRKESNRLELEASELVSLAFIEVNRLQTLISAS